jgi:hypothetical protein
MNLFKTKRRKGAWLPMLCLGIFCIPSTVLADAGTPLMWAGMFHLAIGNALIGLFEGALLVRFFSLRKGRTIGLLIAANYFSAWVGGWFVCGPVVRMLNLDLNNAWRWFWVLVVVTYVMTLVLEWPFVALSFRGTKDWVKRSIKGNLLVQTASYLLIFGWYWMASQTSLFTQMHVVSPDDIHPPPSVLVYFISDQNGDIYVRNLSSMETHKEFDLKSTNENDRLFVQRTESNCWDLAALGEGADDRNPRVTQVRRCFATEAVSDGRTNYNGSERGSWGNFGKVPQLGEAGTNRWEFWAGFWPGEGLRGEDKETGAKAQLSFETPFAQWTVRNATQLPNDEVIFQLGEDQICIFDPNSKKVALLEHGRGPIVGLGEANDKP